MSAWEYKIIPAPTKGIKGKGVKGAEGRFAHALETLMNHMGAEGWEFQRAETLPSIERSGLTGSTTEWRNMLVFRRIVTTPVDDFEPELLPAPVPVSDAGKPDVAKKAAPEPEEVTQAEEPPAAGADEVAGDDSDKDAFVPGAGATEMLPDNGVEATSEVAGMTTSLKNLASQRKKKPDSDRVG